MLEQNERSERKKCNKGSTNYFKLLTFYTFRGEKENNNLTSSKIAQRFQYQF